MVKRNRPFELLDDVSVVGEFRFGSNGLVSRRKDDGDDDDLDDDDERGRGRHWEGLH